MGAGQSDLYKGTYGDNPENIPSCLQGRISFPQNESQYKHFMQDRKGHLPDTKENRNMLVELANDLNYFRGKDDYGNDWHIRINEDGTQDWVRHQNQVINEGGRNLEPVLWNKRTGLYRNIWEEKK